MCGAGINFREVTVPVKMFITMCLYTFPCLLKIGPLVSKGILESVILARP